MFLRLFTLTPLNALDCASGNGPTIGYTYDLANRITVTTELGMSIIMLGLNAGASLVPYLTAWAMTYVGNYAFLIILFVSFVLPIPKIYLTKYYWIKGGAKEAYAATPSAKKSQAGAGEAGTTAAPAGRR